MDLTGAPAEDKLPILEAFVAKHDIEELTWRTVWNDSKVKNFKLGQWVSSLRADRVKLTPAQRKRVEACGVKPRASSNNISVDWDKWFKASLPQKLKMLSKHYKQLCLLQRKNWSSCDFVQKLVIFAHYVEQHDTVYVKRSYVDPGTKFHLGRFVAKMRLGHSKPNPADMCKLKALGFVWNTNESKVESASSPVQSEESTVQSEESMKEEEETKSSKRKREKPDRYTPGCHEPFSNDLNHSEDNDSTDDSDDNKSEESSVCMRPIAKAHRKTLSFDHTTKGEEGVGSLSQLKGEEDEDDLSRLAEKFTTRTELDSRITYIRETVKKASHSIEVDLIEQAMELQKELEPLQTLRGWDKFRSVADLERDAISVKQELQTIDGNMACLHKRCELAKKLKHLQDRIALEQQKAGVHPTNPVCFC